MVPGHEIDQRLAARRTPDATGAAAARRRLRHRRLSRAGRSGAVRSRSSPASTSGRRRFSSPASDSREADLRTAPLCALPFADGSFDLVVTNDVLQHVPEDEVDESLRELRRVLAAGRRAAAADKRRPASTPRARGLACLRPRHTRHRARARGLHGRAGHVRELAVLPLCGACGDACRTLRPRVTTGFRAGSPHAWPAPSADGFSRARRGGWRGRGGRCRMGTRSSRSPPLHEAFAALCADRCRGADCRRSRRCSASRRRRGVPGCLSHSDDEQHDDERRNDHGAYDDRRRDDRGRDDERHDRHDRAGRAGRDH